MFRAQFWPQLATPLQRGKPEQECTPHANIAATSNQAFTRRRRTRLNIFAGAARYSGPAIACPCIRAIICTQRSCGVARLCCPGRCVMPARCRQLNFDRYSAGRCLSTSVRTPVSVSSVSRSGMITSRGNGRDRSGRGGIGPHAN
jgi:hypothetical protein